MKSNYFLSLVFFLFVLYAGSTQGGTGTDKTNRQYITVDSLPKTVAEQLVQEQLAAYNARNIDAFLAPYSDSVELYEYPSKLIAKGKTQMRDMYSKLFREVTNLHCELVNRMVLGNTVIDYESVIGFGPQPVRAIAIYTIEGNKISKVRFIE